MSLKVGERLWVVEEEMDGWFEAKAFDGRYTPPSLVDVCASQQASICQSQNTDTSPIPFLTGDRIGFVPSTYVRKV